MPKNARDRRPKGKKSTVVSDSQVSQPSALTPEAGSSRQPMTSEPQSSNLPRGPQAETEPGPPSAGHDAGETIQKWSPGEWDDDEFDSDAENMSLVLMMKLSHELSLMQESLVNYREFNIFLGPTASGPRHKGLLSNIFSTADRLGKHAYDLRVLRREKQRGTPTQGNMERVAGEISRKCYLHRQELRDLMDQKIDMTDEAEREAWVAKKDNALTDVLGSVLEQLMDLDCEQAGWKEKEVEEMTRSWEKRWKTYGEMDVDDQKQVGWILDVV